MKTLTITTVGSGLGSTVPTVGTHEYADNSIVSGITAIPDIGYSFTRWLLDGVEYTTNPITVVMDRDHVLEAEFSGEPPSPPATYNLTVTSSVGGQTEPDVGLQVYDAGNVVIVTAFPNEGYYFDSWILDGITRTENPLTITMSQDHTLHAIFSLEVVTPKAISLAIPVACVVSAILIFEGVIVYSYRGVG